MTKIITVNDFFEAYTVWNVHHVTTASSSWWGRRARDLEACVPHSDKEMLWDCVTEDNVWEWREIMRFQYGVYQEVPWSWKVVITKEDAAYYPHMSDKFPGMVAVTTSPENGRRDIQTPMKIGKFIKLIRPTWSDSMVKEEVAAIKLHLDPPRLHIAKTRAEIRTVYSDRNGPDSCMKRKYVYVGDDTIHPTEVYAGPDTAVAYLLKDNHVTARTVLYESAKTYVRIYGDDSYLGELLKEKGYSERKTLVGAMLLFLPNAEGHPILPYVDGCAYVSGPFEDEHTHQMVVRVLPTREGAEYEADNTNGYPTVLNSGPICAECEENHVQPGYGLYVEGLGQVCEVCADHFIPAYTDAVSVEYFHQDDSDTPIYFYGGYYYTEDALPHHGLVAIDGEVYDLDNTAEDFLDEGTLIPLNDDTIEVVTDNDRGVTVAGSVRWYEPPEGDQMWFDLANGRIYVGRSPDLIDPEWTTADWYEQDDLIGLFPDVWSRYDTYKIPFSDVCLNVDFRYAIASAIERVVRRFNMFR